MSDLIHRVNVGDSLTRTPRPARTTRGRGRRPPLHLRRAQHLGQPARPRPRRAGYERGDALALASGNSAEFLAVYYACAKLGVVCVPINLGWRADEVAYVLGHSQARGLVVESQLVAAMRRRAAQGRRGHRRDRVPGLTRSTAPSGRPAVGHARQPEADDSHAQARSTTATRSPTSTPRAPRRSPRAWSAAPRRSTWSRCPRRSTRAGADDRFAAMMPMFHTAQLNAFCTPAVMVGATIHVMRGFDPAGCSTSSSASRSPRSSGCR